MSLKQTLNFGTPKQKSRIVPIKISPLKSNQENGYEKKDKKNNAYWKFYGLMKIFVNFDDSKIPFY